MANDLWGTNAPQINKYASGIFGCLDNKTICVKGVFCPCWLMAETQTDAYIVPQWACPAMCAFYALTTIVAPCVCLGAGASCRGRIESSMQLGGEDMGCYNNCCCAWCLWAPCAICQEQRAMAEWRKLSLEKETVDAASSSVGPSERSESRGAPRSL